MIGRPGRSDDFEKGSEVGGLVLSDLLAEDEFSSVWRTEASKGGLPEGCLRAIPAASLSLPNAYERLLEELAFWQDLSGRCAVDLYDCGLDRHHYFLVMRYLKDGSAADWLARGALAGRLEHFALDFASVLRELHGAASAHGNLKPSNVFPLPDGGVLLSDFAIPLWADELDKGCRALEPHLIHPYLDPQQREDIRDFDTRSDVYAFGLIMLRCVTGVEPDPAAPPPRIDESQWPGKLGSVVQKCLAPGRSARPADGFELFDMLSSSLVFVVGNGASTAEPETLDAVADAPALIDRARELTEKGSLSAALDILESVPPDTEGAAELVEEIDRRHRACEVLVQEAVSLAGMNKAEAAMEAVAEAEELWADSPTVIAVKSELAAAAGQDVALLEGRVPQLLLDALEEQHYPAARTHLERLIRAGALSDEALNAVRRFKVGRVRKAFLDSIAAARRLYVLGHRNEAARHWLEAATWLPAGSERNRLRQIAAAARRGSLTIDVQKLGLADVQKEAHPETVGDHPAAAPEPAGTPPEPAQGDADRARRTRRLIITLVCILLGGLAFLILTTIGGD